MSAFIVENKTINEIVTAIKNDAFENDKYFSKYSREELHNELLEMNKSVIRERYGDRYDTSFTVDYHYQEERSAMIQLYKSLSCYLYQCSEGIVPHSRIFKEIERFHAGIADSILYRLPEFKDAEWR